MENKIKTNERINKQKITIKSLVIFFNNYIERNFKNFLLSIKTSDFKNLNYFLELNVRLLSTNKLKYIIALDHSNLASDFSDDLKNCLFKFLMFHVFLINIQFKDLTFLMNLNKQDVIRNYISLINKFYFQNFFDVEKYIKFLKILTSLSLFSFDSKNILNNLNSNYLNNLNKTNFNARRFSYKFGKENEKGIALL